MTELLNDHSAVGSAVFSPCRRYRYRLTRENIDGAGAALFGAKPGYVLWIMLNPSTADAAVNDQTIRRCLSYTRREGYNALVVVNLYAWRATEPDELRLVESPCGPDNDRHIEDAARAASLVICAWGGHMMAAPRARAVEQQLLPDVPLWSLGLTKDGEPRHPSRLGHDEPLRPMNDAARLAG